MSFCSLSGVLVFSLETEICAMPSYKTVQCRALALNRSGKKKKKEEEEQHIQTLVIGFVYFALVASVAYTFLYSIAYVHTNLWNMPVLRDANIANLAFFSPHMPCDSLEFPEKCCHFPSTTMCFHFLTRTNTKKNIVSLNDCWMWSCFIVNSSIRSVPQTLNEMNFLFLTLLTHMISYNVCMFACLCVLKCRYV